MSDESEPIMVKAFAVVETILAAKRPLSLPELAEMLDRPKQTVHRTAKQLESFGFLYREPGRDRYAIGPRLNSVAKDVLAWSIRYTPRHALLTRLVAELGETCNIGVLDGDRVLYIDRVESNFPLRAELHPGSQVPIHCTGLGKLFLAYLPTRTRKRVIDRIDLSRFTPSTICEPDALEAECKRTRERGYAVNNEEFHEGIISLAVPMAPDGEHVVAGLAIHAPAARMSVEQARKHIPTLREYAGKLAADLAAESEKD